MSDGLFTPVSTLEDVFKVPFQASSPSVATSPQINKIHAEKTKSNYLLFENQNVSRMFPSPASSLKQSDFSPWGSPASSSGTLQEKLRQIRELEKKVQDYGQQLKKSQDQITSKDSLLSDLNERNSRLRDQLKSCLAFIKSLQRRNNELEYIHFSTGKSVWGKNGLHLEYNSWNDV
jgi:DNA repair exonuclease SbcCD ATPase subunit